ncbi:phage infection protein [Bacillus cereus]|nr:phage infection protein [Bacillus cereus]
MFLWAFWDPYKQLDDLPVAVVNLDKGAVFDGKPIEVGKGLVDNLKDNTSFKWEFVSEKEAKKGMEGRKYYMLVRIPDDFSSNATTLLKDEPKPLNLEYIPNESLNFLSSQIGGTAIEKIKGEVASTLTKTYAEKMFDSIQDVSKGLAGGAEGASKLHDGSSELHDGSSKVTDGLHTLQGKSGEMKDGVQKLADGSNYIIYRYVHSPLIICQGPFIACQIYTIYHFVHSTFVHIPLMSYPESFIVVQIYVIYHFVHSTSVHIPLMFYPGSFIACQIYVIIQLGHLIFVLVN